jgi:hypothetical protein
VQERVFDRCRRADADLASQSRRVGGRARLRREYCGDELNRSIHQSFARIPIGIAVSI